MMSKRRCFRISRNSSFLYEEYWKLIEALILKYGFQERML